MFPCVKKSFGSPLCGRISDYSSINLNIHLPNNITGENQAFKYTESYSIQKWKNINKSRAKKKNECGLLLWLASFYVPFHKINRKRKWPECKKKISCLFVRACTRFLFCFVSADVNQVKGEAYFLQHFCGCVLVLGVRACVYVVVYMCVWYIHYWSKFVFSAFNFSVSWKIPYD